MKFDIDIRPAEIPAFLRALTDIAVATAWRQREETFAKQIRANPLMERYLESHFGIERAMFRARRYRASTGRIPEPARADMRPLYGFAGMVARVYPRLPAHARDKL